MKRETIEDLINYNDAACCGTCRCASIEDNIEDYDLQCNKYDLAVDTYKICDGYESDGDTF